MGVGGKASRREIVKERAYYGSMVQRQRCLGVLVGMTVDVQSERYMSQDHDMIGRTPTDCIIFFNPSLHSYPLHTTSHIKLP